jgi:hypothetical protein
LINFNHGGYMRITQYQVGPWESSQHLLVDRGKQRNPVSKWSLAGTSGYTLTSSSKSEKEKRV